MRIPNAFENPGPARSEWAYKSRTYIGQIESIDDINGLMRVRIGGTHDSKPVNLPLAGFHYEGINSSWSRYMPEAGAYVRVTYGPQSQVEAVNYVAWGTDYVPDETGRSGVATPGFGGYSTLTKYAKSNENSMRIWRRLRPGEFDLRSRGGAGYFFSKDGRALLEAGTTTLELRKQRFEAELTASLVVAGNDGVEVRFGDVKRLLPTDAVETGVVANPTGAAASKEWSVTVGYPTPPLGTPLLTFYEERAGDVRDVLGVPELGAQGLPLRSRRTWYDASGLAETLSITVDAVGNVSVAQQALAAAGGIDVSLPTNPLTTSALSQAHEAATSFDVTAGTVANISGTAGVNINAGGDADDVLVRGNALNTYLVSKLSVMTAFGPSGPALIPLAPGVELSLLGGVK